MRTQDIQAKNYSSSSDHWTMTSIDSVWTVEHILILDSLDQVSFFSTNIIVSKKVNRLKWLKLNWVFYANQPYYIILFHYNIHIIWVFINYLIRYILQKMLKYADVTQIDWGLLWKPTSLIFLLNQQLLFRKQSL